ncbi:MAG: TrkH family potassium uptake protein, partial [Spirochaetales bacterium]|nr:TrkH family potassium uptake protein [Candidatus Physcosoma equi]
MNINSVARLLAFILLFVALLMGLPTGLSFYYGETGAQTAFIITLALMVVSSLITIVITGRKHQELKIGPKESYLFVTLTWVLISAFGALPLLLDRVFPSFSAAYFEIMSGFTTTGATALNEIESVHKSILFWRNMTNWLGGMGIVVLFVAVLPAFGVKGTALVGAESVGPTKDKLTPQIQQTAIVLWSIYFGLSVLETGILLLTGLDLFNAVTVTFGTMGAAGFTPTNLSIASYHSSTVEWICIVFMFLSGANFALYFRILKGQIKRVVHDGELRLYFYIVLTASLSIALNLFLQAGLAASESLRRAFFQV